MKWQNWLRLDLAALLFFVLYPMVGAEGILQDTLGQPLGSEFTQLFIFALLALGLNVVVGYSGLLHLGIAAFFGAGAYITAILTVPSFPFQTGFFIALVCSTLGAAALGVLLGAPTLRLRGDYLALVTLGFGELTYFAIRNFEFTGGSGGLNPVPSPPDWLASVLTGFDSDANWVLDYRPFYYLSLLVLVIVYLLLRNLENSRLGRSWVAIREDELAATCMGISAVRVKLSAFALGAALAGTAGCLYATKLGNTSGPDICSFSRSTIMLCCVILGGLGSLPGVLLGVFLLIGFDNILAPMIDRALQQSGMNLGDHPALLFSNWRLMIFGLVLILVVRFRPEGLLPSNRVKEELKEYKPRIAPGALGTSTVIKPR